jgi:hypothetical protein
MIIGDAKGIRDRYAVKGPAGQSSWPAFIVSEEAETKKKRG